jgi:hypothetical protein
MKRGWAQLTLPMPSADAAMLALILLLADLATLAVLVLHSWHLEPPWRLNPGQGFPSTMATM